MKFHYLLVGLAIIFFITIVHAADCSNPDISIVVPVNRWYDSGIFDVNMILSADPPLSTTCSCPVGQHCGIAWQYSKNDGNTWVTIPANSSSDLDCTGTTCETRPYPTEDVPIKQRITCENQGVYKIRGYQAYTGKSSPTYTAYCYPDIDCTPPSSGNFNLNRPCNYQNVPLLVDGNYNILAGGNARHNESDINFFSSGTKYVNIHDGGKIDLNKSSLFAGLNFTIKVGGGIIMGVFILTVIGGFFYRRLASKVSS